MSRVAAARFPAAGEKLQSRPAKPIGKRRGRRLSLQSPPEIPPGVRRALFQQGFDERI